jgi:hypothetical protein
MKSLLIVCPLCDSAGQFLSWDGMGRYWETGGNCSKGTIV